MSRTTMDRWQTSATTKEQVPFQPIGTETLISSLVLAGPLALAVASSTAETTRLDIAAPTWPSMDGQAVVL